MANCGTGRKIRTFHLALKDQNSDNANIWFSVAQIFAGIDIYNGGSSDAVVNISFARDAHGSVSLKPGNCGACGRVGAMRVPL